VTSRLSALSALALFVLTAVGDAGAQAGASDEASRSFAVISDIHFDPISTPGMAEMLVASRPDEGQATFGSEGAQAFSRFGEDTNLALLSSAMAALSHAAGTSDFLLVTGDLLAHRFEERAASALGTTPNAQAVRELTTKTVGYVARSLQAALPGRPIILALGNNDSDCGDYRIAPQGAFLAATRDTVRQLAGPDLVAADFDETYMAGGYYRMRHPTLPKTTILVLNDVLWASEYRNSCGDNGLAAANAMMSWLERELIEARTEARRIWLVHHIPVGVDSYASLQHTAASACPSSVTLFLNEPFASRFLTLLRTFASTLQASFSGHIHRDSYRLVMDGDRPVGLDKIAPAISPIFGNAPGFHVFNYNPQAGGPSNFSTWYLANLEHVSGNVSADWRQEYNFTEAYGEATYSMDSVGRVLQAVSGSTAAGETMRKTFDRVYAGVQSGTGADAVADICAISNLDAASFKTCVCGK
jgi:hypothetical protein